VERGRLSKVMQRRLMVLWRDQPSQADIEALEANTKRVGLVIRLRWAIVGAIVVFSVLGVGIYTFGGQAPLMWRQMIIPALALLLVLVYNAYYQRTYRQFGNLALFNAGQLLLDIAVVTVLIYYSGGVYSWFDAMYYLFVLEAALILPTRREVWWVAGAAIFAYLGVLTLVLAGVLPHTPMPFVANNLQAEASYVAVRALWTVTVIIGTAIVGELLVRSMRERTAALVEQATRDLRTGLYDRTYVRREVAVEIERAKRFHRGLSVILADIDRFEHFNELFGTDAGNRIIDRIADVLRRVAGCDTAEPCLVVAGRYGGEEFALIVPEDGTAALVEALPMAERLRAEIAAILDEDRSVSVSVGVAGYPRDGRTASELLSAADAALVSAAAEGGNRVVVGRPEPGPE
jgi:diguanylate cyclase (GGDEF)-like protein